VNAVVITDRENSRVPLTRMAWLATVIVCVITAIVLFLDDYAGYAGVTLAVAASAAINLR
jgi:hypothetical protein